jgi:ubiquinone/menaquinone biosynthesis C-methylase UbiE
MTVLDVGPGMGFFTLPMARMVGREGKVIAVEAQEGMLAALRKRARRAGLGARIIPRIGLSNSLVLEEYDGKIDFALAFAVIHELPNVPRFFRELAAALKPGALSLIAEPKGHTSAKEFEEIQAAAEKARLIQVDRPKIFGCYAALLEKSS